MTDPTAEGPTPSNLPRVEPDLPSEYEVINGQFVKTIPAIRSGACGEEMKALVELAEKYPQNAAAREALRCIHDDLVATRASISARIELCIGALAYDLAMSSLRDVPAPPKHEVPSAR